MGPDERGRGRATSGDASRRRDPGRARVEARQLRLADRDDRNAARLEVLERGRDVEDRLRAGAHDGHRRARRAPRGPTRCRASAALAGAEARRARRDGRRRCRPSRRPRSRRRAPRSSSPRPSWPPSRRRPAPRRGSAARPCGRTRRAPWQAPPAPPRQPDEQPPVVDRDRRRDRAARRGPPPRRRVATSRFCGYGRPWLISVDSSATTGRPSASAAATSALRRRGGRAMRCRARPALMPSGSSGRGAASAGAPPRGGRPARRGGAPRRRRQPGRARREPADEEPGVERVAGAGRVDAATVAVATSNRMRCDPRPAGAGTRGALRAALDDRDRREVEQAVHGVAAEERVRLGRGREQEVRAQPSPISARAARRPPASSGPIEARSMLTRSAPAARAELDRPPAGLAERLAEQRVDRQVDGVGPGEPVRPAGRPAPAGPRRRGRRRTSARRRAPRRRRSGRSARRRPGRRAASRRRPRSGLDERPARRRRARPPR